MKTQWTTYQDCDLYDGWILKFRKVGTECQIEWRDHYIVERLTNEQKTKIEQQVKTSVCQAFYPSIGESDDTIPISSENSVVTNESDRTRD